MDKNWQQQIKVQYPKDKCYERLQRLKTQLHKMEWSTPGIAIEAMKPGTLSKYSKRKQKIIEEIKELEKGL